MNGRDELDSDSVRTCESQAERDGREGREELQKGDGRVVVVEGRRGGRRR